MHDYKPVINLIQDLATPHNNVLIRHFMGDLNAKIKLWYARDLDSKLHPWAKSITHEHFPAEIYGDGFNWRFLRYCLFHPNERYVIVGWANTNTRLLHLLFFLLRRPYNHWTDLPSSHLTAVVGVKQKFLRWLAYRTLKYSKSKVFGVGVTTLEYFRRLGFEESRLVNLPIFVETDEDLPAYHTQRERIIRKYAIKPEDCVLIAGSRIVHEKGYDLLIRAIALIDPAIRQHLKVIIVGSGPSVPELELLIENKNLTDIVTLDKWLAIEDFKALVANSDIFIHPAREDSYGGTTLGMALGIPVIGSYGAGAAVDRIQHGQNGLLYETEDIQSLSHCIVLLYQNPDLRRRMGQEALKTARAWPPTRGVQILVKQTI